MLLWKAIDQHGSPDVSISEYGWKIDDGIMCTTIDSGPPGPPLLRNAISGRSRTKGKSKEAIVAVTVKYSAAQNTASAQQVNNSETHLRRNRRWMSTMTMNMMVIM